MMFKKIAIFCTLIVGFHAGSALAITPGNVTLDNTATLSYSGGGSITATASVVVNVIAATPTLSTQGAITKAENQPISGTEASYTVTATNNGPDTYTFQPSTLATGTGLGNDTNTTFTNVSYKYQIAGGDVTEVALGASALAAGITAGATSFTIPNDGGTANATVNGLTNGDTIIIDGGTYVINAVIDDSSTTGNITISVNTGIVDNGSGLGIGTGVFERKTFNVVTSGTAGVGVQTTSGTAANYDVTTTLRPTLTVPTAADATATFTVNIVNVTILKYVRNVTRGNFSPAAAACTDFDVTVDSVTYYLTTGDGSGCTVEARPAEVLEYLVQVTTPAGGALTGAKIADAIDSFTVYKAGTTKMGSNTVTTPAAVNDEGTGNNSADSGGSTGFPLASTADDSGLLIQDTATASAGDEGDGTVAASATVNVIYQVDVR
jgi:hypothetical protein